jgi:hypothetical protein
MKRIPVVEYKRTNLLQWHLIVAGEAAVAEGSRAHANARNAHAVAENGLADDAFLFQIRPYRILRPTCRLRSVCYVLYLLLHAHRQIFTIIQKASGRKPKLDDDMERLELAKHNHWLDNDNAVQSSGSGTRAPAVT